MTNVADLKIKIFADGADLKDIERLDENPLVKGFTTNPTLMRKAGVADYRAFAKDAIRIVGDKPISFEVFSDDFDGMERQARIIAGWGDNVFVKIPVTNTRGESSAPLLRRLYAAKVKVNITAIFTPAQLDAVQGTFWMDVPHILSIFVGRINDTGRAQPFGFFKTAYHQTVSKAQTLWASTREVYNIWEADEAGFDIITVTPDILGKLSLIGKDLTEFSRETVQMFYNDAVKAGYTIEEPVHV